VTADPRRSLPAGYTGNPIAQLLRTGSMLQWPDELQAFLDFMLAHRVSSFLEIGSATGRLTLFVKTALSLRLAAACDVLYPPLLRLRSDIAVFCGDHHAPKYLEWRAALGRVDMVLIDADHETGFRRDYEIERSFPHGFLAFHDIANRAYPALGAFWRDEVEGEKREFVNADVSRGFGVPTIKFPLAQWPTLEDYLAECGPACGIGIVGPSAAAAAPRE